MPQLAELAKKTKKKREEQAEEGESARPDSPLEALRKRAGKESAPSGETHKMGGDEDSDRPKRESFQSDAAYRAAHAAWAKKARKRKAEEQARAVERKE